MECSCTVDVNLDDYCECILTPTLCVALLPHKCNECSTEIKPKEEYIFEITEYDGDINTHTSCLSCYSLRQIFFSSGWYYGDIREQMAEFIEDCQGDISVSCILQLTKSARDWVLDLVEEEYNKYED